MKNKYDLIIVGGGVLGTFHAYHAVARGLKVALLERNSQPRGATVRNFGQIVPSGMDTKWQNYGRKSLEIYKSVQSRFDITVQQNGTIYLASNVGEMQLAEELQAINNDNDYPSELWTAAQCKERYPTLREDYCVGGIYFPEEISVNPRVMIHRLQDFMQENTDIDFRMNCTVNQILTKDNGVFVSTNTGEAFEAKKAIVCSGSEFKILFPEIFNASDIVAVKLQMLRLQAQKNVHLHGNILTALSIRRYESFKGCPSYKEVTATDAPDSFWKKWGIHILFKQDADGSIILGDSHEYADARDIDDLDFGTRSNINQYFINEGKKIFDLKHWNIASIWNGMYCQCKTQDIFNEEIAPNIHIVTGIGGKGMTASAGYSFDNLQKIYS